MKQIKRRYYESMNAMTMKTGTFVCTGQWADGHLAYSRLDDNGEIIEEDEGMFVQLRSNYGYLYMQRI